MPVPNSRFYLFIFFSLHDSHFNNNNNNNNNACPINKEQFEEVLKSVQTTKMPLTLQVTMNTEPPPLPPGDHILISEHKLNK